MLLFVSQTQPEHGPENQFDAGIDHGRELSVLYQTLKEQMSKLDQVIFSIKIWLYSHWTKTVLSMHCRDVYVYLSVGLLTCFPTFLNSYTLPLHSPLLTRASWADRLPNCPHVEVCIWTSCLFSSQNSKDKLESLQVVLDSLSGAYKEFEGINANDSNFVPRKWASSSDLIHEDDITLTPVQPHKPPQHKDDSPTIERKTPDWRMNTRRSHRLLPTPKHLIVAPEEIIVASPYDLENRRFSSPILGLDENTDLSSTVSSSHLRRHSYLNAVNDDVKTTPRRFTENSAALQNKIRKTKLSMDKSILRNGSDVDSYESLSSEEGVHSPTKLDHSRPRADTPPKISRQRPWSLAIDSPSRNFQTSPQSSKSPHIITDRSRTLQATSSSPRPPGSPRTQRKASPLAIIDSITRGPTERDSDHSSPASSPVPQRRTPQPSPSLLRVQSEHQTKIITANINIARTPSGTSTSSSGSSGSWRSSSFGSAGADRSRRRHILPLTPDRQSTPTRQRRYSK